MVDVCLPGTGGFMPLPDRWLTCCWLEYRGRALLVDCGEGTQIALRAAGCKLSRLDTLLLTHYHADHVAGLPGLLLTLGNSGARAEPLTVAGPPGLRQVLQALLVVAPLCYPLELVELPPGGELDCWDGLSVSCLPLEHRIPCYGYRMTVRRKPVFNPGKAEALGVPRACWRTLHAGEAVRLEDGRSFYPEQVLDGAREPVVVSYATDTLPVDAVAKLGEGADLMIAEGMYGDDGMAERLGEKTHSLFSQSAALAARAGAKRLWLTHYSPALTDPEEWIWAARARFPAAEAAYDGIRIELGAPGRKGGTEDGTV